MSLEQTLQTKIDVVNRRIYLDEEISSSHATMVEVALTYFESVDNTKPVTIWICSEGGDINSGYAIIDSMRSRAIQVNTHCYGQAFSMAAWILAAGDSRSISSNSFVMVHEGQFTFAEESMSHTQIQQQRKFHSELEKIGWKLLASFTKRTANWWSKECKVGEFYITSNKAKTLGIVDKVV